jgi:hypothetical protein
MLGGAWGLYLVCAWFEAMLYWFGYPYPYWCLVSFSSIRVTLPCHVLPHSKFGPLLYSHTSTVSHTSCNNLILDVLF